MGEPGRAGVRLLVAWLVACLLGSCGSRASQPLVIGAQAAVPWPPQPVRQPSDYDQQLFGNEWSLKSDSVDSYGYSLRLDGEGDLPWAIYAVGGLGPANELQQVSVDFSAAPLAHGDGTQLFVGLADYRLDAWTWLEPAEPSPWLHVYDDPQDFRNSGGAAYLAVALAGPGSASVNAITFSAGGSLVQAPQNLAAFSPVVGRIELSWDAVAGAAGYNVYRSGEADMSPRQQLNAAPLAEASFTDEPVVSGRFYFYQVAALAGEETAPSNTAAVWAHEVELAAPMNFQLIARGADSITFGWEPTEPGEGYFIYMDKAPGFPIIEAVTDERPVGRWKENIEISTYQDVPLDLGTYYYAKLCARDLSNRRGRMSGEAFGRTGGGWDWGDVSVIDKGHLPLRAVKAGAEIAVAYFKGYSVNLAVGAAGQWSRDTALPDSGELLFTNWMDLAYADGLFLIGAMDKAAGDVWAAYGVPGAWTREHLHGDGNIEPIPLHVESGFYVTCAVSADELAVLHLFDQPPPDIPTILLHTRPRSGGAWTDSDVRTFDMSEISYPLVISHSLRYFAGDLFYLCNDGGETASYFTHRGADWSFSGRDIRGGGSIFRTGHDLARFNSTWYTTAFDNQAAVRGLYLLSGDENVYPWSKQPLTPVGEARGYNARLDSEGEEAAVVYYGDGAYHFALYSSGWAAEQIAVPGVVNFSDQVEILLRDGEAYFVFQDEDTEEIKVAHGVPPGA